MTTAAEVEEREPRGVGSVESEEEGEEKEQESVKTERTIKWRDKGVSRTDEHDQGKT